MRVTKRQLRKIIKEEVSGNHAHLMTDEQLLEEGLLDFLGGLFKKFTGVLSKGITAAAKSLAPEKEANTYIAKAAEKVSKKTGKKIKAKKISDLDLKTENGKKVFFMSQIPFSQTVSSKVLEEFKKADGVKDWTPPAEEGADEEEKWWSENKDGILALSRATGSILGMLDYYYESLSDAGLDVSQFKKAADARGEGSDQSPAALCKWIMDSTKSIQNVFSGDDQGKKVAKEYAKIYKAAQVLGKKVASAAKEQQKEWAMARRAVGEILNEDKVKIKRYRIQQHKRIIAEGTSRFQHVVRTSTGVFGRPMQIDEESDGNLVIVADEAEVEKHYSELMSVFPHGQMTEDGFATGVYEDMSRAPFRESSTKVTKNQLRRIIREEALKFLREGEGADMIKREFREEDEIEEAHHEEGEKSENDEVKESIRRIVRETVSLEKGRDLGYGEGEGRMTKGQLSKIAREAQSLHDTLLDHDDLPEWVQSKIAVSANNISKVKDYLEYKIMRMKIDGSEQDHPVLKALLDVVDEG